MHLRPLLQSVITVKWPMGQSQLDLEEENQEEIFKTGLSLEGVSACSISSSCGRVVCMSFWGAVPGDTEPTGGRCTSHTEKYSWQKGLMCSRAFTGVW